MIDIVSFLVLSFGSYRIVRFLIFDTLIEHARQRFYVRLANAQVGGWAVKRALAHWLLGAISCSWCLGVWVTGGVYWLYTNTNPLGWGRLGWLTYAGLTGLQGLLHAFEPDGE